MLLVYTKVVWRFHTSIGKNIIMTISLVSEYTFTYKVAMYCVWKLSLTKILIT